MDAEARLVLYADERALLQSSLLPRLAALKADHRAFVVLVSRALQSLGHGHFKASFEGVLRAAAGLEESPQTASCPDPHQAAS